MTGDGRGECLADGRSPGADGPLDSRAIPVCAHGTADRLAQVADDLICVEKPVAFFAVGEWYEDFSQTRKFSIC